MRGPGFVRVMLDSYLVTGDEIFKDAVEALLKHGIIDHKGNLTGAPPRIAQAMLLQLERKNILSIRRRIEGGQTLQRACAETAAEMGHQANSFAAAIKDLKKKYKREAELELPSDDAFRRDRDALRLELDNWKQEYEGRIARLPTVLRAIHLAGVR